MVYAVIGGLGTYYCFTVNRNNDNKDFIIRFIVLGWPASIRWILLFFVIYSSLYILYRSVFSSSLTLSNHWVGGMYNFILEVIYFYMLSNYINIVGLNAKQKI